jgi:hypothetical protein
MTHIAGRWAPICQACWELAEPDQYFPEATDYRDCAACGDYALTVNAHPEVARAAVARAEDLRAEAEGAFGPTILHGDV